MIRAAGAALGLIACAATAAADPPPPDPFLLDVRLTLYLADRAAHHCPGVEADAGRRAYVTRTAERHMAERGVPGSPEAPRVPLATFAARLQAMVSGAAGPPGADPDRWCAFAEQEITRQSTVGALLRETSAAR